MPAPRVHPEISREWRLQPALHRGHYSDVLINAWMAVALIGGGRQRAGAPAYATLRESGGPYVWGALFGVAAVCLLVGTTVGPRTHAVTLRLAAAPLVVFGLMIGHAAAVDPLAGVAGLGLALYPAWQAVSRADTYADIRRREVGTCA